MRLSRRSLVGQGLMGMASLMLAPALSVASVASATQRRLVVVLLRGGLDGLAAVPAPGDSNYRTARGEMALDETVPLSDIYALHPSLAPLQPLWASRELAVVHAVGLPYRKRSHFDAQNVLENGTERPFGAETGWLGRALAALPGSSGALTAGRSLPLLVRGASAANTDLVRAPRIDPALLAQVEHLYAGDPLLQPILEQALRTEELIARFRDPSREDKDGMNTLGCVLGSDDGPRVAVVERGGFDTHTGQRADLTRELSDLASALLALRQGLGAAWSETAVLVVTEFGRSVRSNGTGGTDHGVGGAALVLGGTIDGGRVLARWPGLAPDDLYEGRDLQPTTDLRSVFAAALCQHLGIDERIVAREVFSETSLAPLPGLFRV